MTNQLGGSFCRKIGKNGNDNGFVRVDGEESNGPSGRITGTKGNFVPFPDAGSLEENMVLFNAGSKLSIRIADTAIIA